MPKINSCCAQMQSQIYEEDVVFDISYISRRLNAGPSVWGTKASKIDRINRDILYSYDQDRFDEKAEEERKKGFMEECRKTVQAQARYVLNKLGELTGRSDYIKEEIGKLGKNNIDRKTFEKIYDTVAAGKEYDSDFKEKVNQIVEESSYEENIGATNPAYEDMAKYAFLPSEEKTFNENYTRAVTDKILSEFGYTREELDVFEPYIRYPEDPSEGVGFDDAGFVKAREEFVAAKIKALPEDERTPLKFIDEFDKVNVAVRACLLYEKHNVTSGIKNGLFPGLGSNERVQELADECISASGNASYIEGEFNAKYQNFDASSKDVEKDYRGLVGAIEVLQEKYDKRPWYSRFADFFRNNAEDAALSRMKDKLKTVENILKENNVKEETVKEWKSHPVHPDANTRIEIAGVILSDPRNNPSWNERLFNKGVEEFDVNRNASTSYKELVGIVEHLKEAHASRPWYSRLGEFFSKDGGRRTINRMEEKLMEVEARLKENNVSAETIEEWKQNPKTPKEMEEAERLFTNVRNRPVSAKLEGDYSKKINEEVYSFGLKESNQLKTDLEVMKDKIGAGLDVEKNKNAEIDMEKSKSVVKENSLEK